MTAAAEGQLEVVQLLLDRGADPSLEDADGDTALSFAREKGHLEVADLLKDSGATD
jgi:ankyrin repeat protein